jgi:outer membrane lipoprotein-sorting protein
MTQELYSKFGITWYGDESDDEMDKADDQLRGLMRRIVALHDKLHGYVALRVLLLANDKIKFVYDSESNMTIIGNDHTVFPGDTPLFSRTGMAPEVYYNSKIRDWLKSLLVKEVQTLETKYANYILALDKLATEGASAFAVSTE